MKNHAIKKLIDFYDLSQFEKNAKQDLFSVYFYETDTAILCHSGLFFDASTKKASKEQYLQNLSKAFKILPVKTANIFKEYLDLTALHNCKPTYGKRLNLKYFINRNIINKRLYYLHPSMKIKSFQLKEYLHQFPNLLILIHLEHTFHVIILPTNQILNFKIL